MAASGHGFGFNIGTLMITYTILGVPYYTHNGLQHPILIIKVPLVVSVPESPLAS